ncbi:MAG: alpha/beta fold hydrolase [Chlamydiota bacterium]|nr:alpha/beta fold hydrolase [Chlamydiota bacterium]
MKRVWFILIAVFVIGISAFVFLRNNNQIQSSPLIQTISQSLPNATPAPFYEMTIPHLREREYKSSLGELDQATETSSYIGYLTSYDSDGLRVNGYLTIPKGQEPQGGWPAIVFVHGYIPPASYRTLENYSSYVDALARSGFVVFKIDLRGHGNSEGEPGGGYYSGDYIIDTLNARSALQSSDFVSPQRIGLWGHSMSGNVVARAFAAEDVPAAVIWAGAVYTYTDFSEYGIDDNSYRPPSEDSEVRRKRNELFETHGDFDPQDDFWKQVPMTNYLSGIKGAIQLNHAVNDPVVSIDYSRNLNRILNGTSIQHELKEYSSGGHNFTGSDFAQVMQNTVEFFRKNL